MTTMLGREFESEEQAETCYQQYARKAGFGIRRDNIRRNVNGNITGRTWVCSREGFRAAKYLQKRSRQREPRPLTRSGCQAQFRIILNSERKRWSCNYFQAVHNHNLTPPQLVHHLRSHRTVTDPELVMATSLQRVGVTPLQIHEFMVDRSGGYNRVGYNRVDVQNKLASNRRRHLKESDAETCLSYLEGKKSSDPSFFYDITVTSSNRLGDLFWCDGRSCADYALFGDVIAFDATYKTNAYRKPFVVILGINHHRRSIVFGFALLSDETEHTYTWLLETFLTAMNNKQPKAVITDGDKAMRNAIIKAFPQASHRLCCWHLARNAQTNVTSTEFTKDFRRFMLNAYSEEEFETKWKLMVEKHQVGQFEWVRKMYDERQMWAEAFLRGKFFGSMRSTQRSEGMNAFLNHYVNRRLRLIDFVKQMDRLMDRQREGEGKDNFDNCEGSHVLITHLKMYERQAAVTYTRAMFRLVRDELEKEGLLMAIIGGRDVMSTTYFVRHFGVSGNEVKVVITKPTNTVCCCCKLFETNGIPCSHTFVVLKAENITEIPRSIILSRWTKDAKIMDHSSLETCSTIAHYMTEEARVGLIFSSCRTLLRYAASSVGAYNVAITNIHNLTLRLEAMCQKDKSVAEPVRRSDNVVQDPDIVLTKGSLKRPKLGQQQQRKCSRCGVPGHNVRKCKHNTRQNQPFEDSCSQYNDIFSGSNVLRQHGLDRTLSSHVPSQHPHSRATKMSVAYPNTHCGVPLGSLSDSWLEHIPTTTDSDTSIPTLNTSTSTGRFNSIATSFCGPTNYGDIRKR
ncbi:protein FAR1-RELATED SEQUENCE 5 [Citrus sinensis]|nr:protein FAR1-RELATED SEQUENCE 5 [Citrus sinensis]